MHANDDVLHLRFRGWDDADQALDVAAFGAGPRRSDETLARPEDVGVQPGTRPLPPRPSLLIFFQHPAFAIPAPGCERDGTLDLSSWSVRATTFGWLACVPPRQTQRPHSRAAWVVAACLPLALAGEVNAATSGDGPPGVQRPSKPRDVPVPQAVEATTEPVPEPEPEPAAAQPPLFDEPDVQDGSVTSPSVDVRRRAMQAGPDPAIVDAAWEGVDGFDVELRLKGGVKLTGRVGAVQADTFTLIQAHSGSVLVLPKSGVVSLNVRTPKPIPSRTGNGLIAGGVVLTTIAAPVFITGAVFLGVCPSCTYLHLPMLLVGAGALGGAIPMMIRGGRLRRARLEAVEGRQFSAVFAPTRSGWSGGLRFRF